MIDVRNPFDWVVTTSKIARGGELIQERKSYGHDSIDYLNPSIDWGATSLAVQLRLGLLPEWRTRLDSFDCNHSRLDGAYLNDLALISENSRSLQR